MKGKVYIQTAVLAVLLLCLCLMTACGSTSSSSEPSAYGKREPGSGEAVSTSEDETAPTEPEEEPEEEPEVPEEMPEEEAVEDAEEEDDGDSDVSYGIFEQIEEAKFESDASALFTEDWYTKYMYFEDSIGSTLEVIWIGTEDGDLLEFAVNGLSSSWLLDSAEYTKVSRGGYQYINMMDPNGTMTYYPAEGKIVLAAYDDTYTYYCDWDASETEANRPGTVNYYLTDRVDGDVFSIVPHYMEAKSSSSGGYTQIKVYCSVANMSDSNAVFYGSTMGLYNQGVVVSGSSSYDGMTIASGGGFDGMITFSFPYGANTNPTFMYMTFGAENQRITLEPGPQYGDSWYTVEGFYRLADNPSDNLQLIVEKAGSTYVIFQYNGLIGWRVFTSDLVDNVLTIDGHSYKYDEEQVTLYCSFSQQTWAKINDH